jgi:hypothetical protein
MGEAHHAVPGTAVCGILTESSEPIQANGRSDVR